jgi:hypothetical protein
MLSANVHSTAKHYVCQEICVQFLTLQHSKDHEAENDLCSFVCGILKIKVNLTFNFLVNGLTYSCQQIRLAQLNI